MEYLKVGKIFKTYGLQGELRVFSTSDFPTQRLKKGNNLYLFKEGTEERIPVTISKSKSIGGDLYVISLKGYTHINDVEKFVGYELQVEKDNKFLPKDTYFTTDLEECVVYQKGQEIGKVLKVEDYCGRKSLRVKYNDKEILIPFNPFFVKDVDIDNKKINVELIEGML